VEARFSPDSYRDGSARFAGQRPRAARSISGDKVIRSYLFLLVLIISLRSVFVTFVATK
jgi:hypothetical protein